jgi:hypothetical protein
MWFHPMVPDGLGGEEPTDGEKDYSIVLQMPEELKKRLIRIPKGVEWPFFKQLMDNQVGERQWIAGSYGDWTEDEGIQIWEDSPRTPKPGQLAFIHWLYEKETFLGELDDHSAANEFWAELSKTVEEDFRRKQEEEMTKRLIDSWSKPTDCFCWIMTRTTMTEISSTEMGGNTGPLQECSNMVQAPLPPDDKAVRYVNPKILFPRIDIRERVHTLETLVNTGGFLLMMGEICQEQRNSLF